MAKKTVFTTKEEKETRPISFRVPLELYVRLNECRNDARSRHGVILDVKKHMLDAYMQLIENAEAELKRLDKEAEIDTKTREIPFTEKEKKLRDG